MCGGREEGSNVWGEGGGRKGVMWGGEEERE